MGFHLSVMPIFTHALILGHLKGNMLGFNHKNDMAIEKEVTKEGLKGPEGVKGPNVFF